MNISSGVFDGTDRKALSEQQYNVIDGSCAARHRYWATANGQPDLEMNINRHIRIAYEDLWFEADGSAFEEHTDALTEHLHQSVEEAKAKSEAHARIQSDGLGRTDSVGVTSPFGKQVSGALSTGDQAACATFRQWYEFDGGDKGTRLGYPD